MPKSKTEIQEILNRLDTPVSVLYGQEAAEIIKDASTVGKEGIYSKEGYLYACTDDAVLRTEDRTGSADLLKMLLLLMEKEDNSVPHTVNEALKRLIEDKAGTDETQEMIRRFGLRTDGHYRLAVFITDRNRHYENAYTDLLSIFPLEQKDVLVRMNGHEFVLVHECEADENAEDTIEYCLALCDTAESEADIRLKAGISAMVSSPTEFSSAYRQGQNTVRVAIRFNRLGPVWIYDKMLLEYFLNEIPSSVYDELRSRVMTAEVRKLLNGEMLETVNMFFKCDLNLSDTARQMFIHRNTLMYRLDKIQKITGMDLRKFYDAVVFRIIMELPDT